MTIAKKATAKITNTILFDARVVACLVTGQPQFAKRLIELLGENHVKVKSRLADLIFEEDCQTFIVDTKVRDIDTWPAPLLLQPSMAHKPWLFLLEGPSEGTFLRNLPPDCAFFGRTIGELDNIASLISKRFRPDSRTRIENVEYIEHARTFVVLLENGRAYALKLDDLPESDASEVTRWALSRNKHYFRIAQESGNTMDVPWDDVLYHCEPGYEYYKGRQTDHDDQDRAMRIGRRVRELRTHRLLSITDLAKRAGMKRPNLSRLESGKHIPSLETLERVAEALGVPVAHLIAADVTGSPER